MSIARSIRLATEEDLAAVEGIESAADGLFEPLLGPEPFGAESATAGDARAAEPGFLLVAAESEGSPAVGFVHVLEPTGPAGLVHLEQLAVLPEHLRRGHGRALVEAAAAEAASRGGTRLTLRTFAEVPWNRPFYAACGFRVVGPIDSDFHRGLARTEEELGLTRLGTRVLMARDLTAPAACSAPPAASSRSAPGRRG
ncbi:MULTISPECIES: GNAT family N-acetyltransferase [unclassified Brachybacterium]|uniref:GNAT family N-acetyltransferase n=1 Tax=unclassified Brachybacterium TaxID=2623841 RepID=UPI0036070C0B